jgi:hypothetical protein
LKKISILKFFYLIKKPNFLVGLDVITLTSLFKWPPRQKRTIVITITIIIAAADISIVIRCRRIGACRRFDRSQVNGRVFKIAFICFVLNGKGERRRGRAD